MEENKELIRRIEALENWKTQREKQQIVYPLDQQSIEVLNRYFPRILDKVILTFVGASARYVPVLLGKQGENTFELSSSYVRYTAEPSTDKIYIVDKNQTSRFGDDEQVILYVDLLTGDTTPAGLSDNTTYYVVNASTDGYSFQLSLTEGGSAINITSKGVGKQFITKI